MPQSKQQQNTQQGNKTTVKKTQPKPRMDKVDFSLIDSMLGQYKAIQEKSAPKAPEQGQSEVQPTEPTKADIRKAEVGKIAEDRIKQLNAFKKQANDEMKKYADAHKQDMERLNLSYETKSKDPTATAEEKRAAKLECLKEETKYKKDISRLQKKIQAEAKRLETQYVQDDAALRERYLNEDHPEVTARIKDGKIVPANTEGLQDTDPTIKPHMDKNGKVVLTDKVIISPMDSISRRALHNKEADTLDAKFNDEEKVTKEFRQKQNQEKSDKRASEDESTKTKRAQEDKLFAEEYAKASDDIAKQRLDEDNKLKESRDKEDLDIAAKRSKEEVERLEAFEAEAQKIIDERNASDDIPSTEEIEQRNKEDQARADEFEKREAEIKEQQAQEDKLRNESRKAADKETSEKRAREDSMRAKDHSEQLGMRTSTRNREDRELETARKAEDEKIKLDREAQDKSFKERYEKETTELVDRQTVEQIADQTYERECQKQAIQARKEGKQGIMNSNGQIVLTDGKVITPKPADIRKTDRAAEAKQLQDFRKAEDLKTKEERDKKKQDRDKAREEADKKLNEQREAEDKLNPPDDAKKKERQEYDTKLAQDRAKEDQELQEEWDLEDQAIAEVRADEDQQIKDQHALEDRADKVYKSYEDELMKQFAAEDKAARDQMAVEKDNADYAKQLEDNRVAGVKQVLDNPEHPELSPENNLGLSDNLKAQFEKDEKEHPEAYGSDKAKEERQNKLIESAAETVEAVRAEKQQHPEFYATKELAEERMGLIMNAIQVEKGLYGPDSPQAKMAKEHPFPGLQDGEKTFTDMFKGKDGRQMHETLNTLVESGFIAQSNGSAFEKAQKPWDHYDHVKQALNEGAGVFVQQNKGDEFVHVQQNDTSKKPELNDKLKFKSKEFVNPKIKAETIEALKGVKKQLDQIGKTKGDSPEYTAMYDAIDGTIEKLTNAKTKKEFNESMKDLGEKSEKYVFAKTNQHGFSKRLQRVDCAKEISNVFKAATMERSLEAEKQKPNYVANSLQKDIASKMVKSFTEVYMDSKNEKLREMAKSIAEDPKKFEQQVNRLLVDPAFTKNFGTLKNPKSVEDLTKMANASGKDLLKVGVEATRQMNADQRKQEMVRNMRVQQRSNKPVSPEMRKECVETIREMKDKFNSYNFAKSDEFAELRDVLNDADALLSANPKANVRDVVNYVGDVADKYTMKCLNDSQHFDTGIDRIMEAEKLKHLSDNMINNKLPSENPFDEKKAMERAIAGKLAMHAANGLKDGTQKDKDLAERIMHDPKTFNKKVAEVMNSDGFKQLIEGKNEKELKSLLKSSPKDLNKELIKKQRATEAQKKKELEALEKNKKLQQPAKQQTVQQAIS